MAFCATSRTWGMGHGAGPGLTRERRGVRGCDPGAHRKPGCHTVTVTGDPLLHPCPVVWPQSRSRAERTGGQACRGGEGELQQTGRTQGAVRAVSLLGGWDSCRIPGTPKILMREKEPLCGPDVLTHGEGHASSASWGADPPQQLNHRVILCPPRGPASAFRKTLGCSENQRRGNGPVGMSSPRSEAQAERKPGSAHARRPGLRGHVVGEDPTSARPRRRPAPVTQHSAGGMTVPPSRQVPRCPRTGRRRPRAESFRFPCAPRSQESPATVTPEPQTVKCFSKNLFSGVPPEYGRQVQPPDSGGCPGGGLVTASHQR